MNQTEHENLTTLARLLRSQQSLIVDLANRCSVLESAARRQNPTLDETFEMQVSAEAEANAESTTKMLAAIDSLIESWERN
jgi:hypothetical protein